MEKIEKMIDSWLSENMDKLELLHLQKKLSEIEYGFWAKYWEGEDLISPEQELEAYLSLVKKLKGDNNEK